MVLLLQKVADLVADKVQQGLVHQAWVLDTGLVATGVIIGTEELVGTIITITHIPTIILSRIHTIIILMTIIIHTITITIRMITQRIITYKPQ